MTTAIAGVRAHIASALATLGIDIHTYPEGSVTPPCALLLPGSPYRDGGVGWDAVNVGIDVRIVVADGFGLNSQATLDAYVDAACDALASASVEVGQVPSSVPDAEQAVLTCDIPTLTTWKD